MASDAAFVGSIPQFYDQGLGPILFHDYAVDLAQRVAALAPRTVLETAAGTGILTRELRDVLPADAQMLATDLNGPMLEVARRKFRPEEQVVFQTADAMALPFPEATFEVVACQFGVMFYPDKPRSYGEAFRVLVPGGRYVFNVWDSHAHNPFGRITHAVSARFFPADPPNFYGVPFSLHQVDLVREALVNAGFVELSIAILRREMVIPDLKDFARAAINGNPILDQILDRGGAAPEDVIDALVVEFEKAFGTNPSRLTRQAIVYSAQRPG